MIYAMDMVSSPSGGYMNRQQMANMQPQIQPFLRRDIAQSRPSQNQQPASTPISYMGESAGFGRGADRPNAAYQPATGNERPDVAFVQQNMGPAYRSTPNRASVPSMDQLMGGIYGGFNPYMGSRSMGRGMGYGGFNPYMGGGGMGYGGFNPYMGRSMPMQRPQPMQLPDFARQMYGIGQQVNPYAPRAEQIRPAYREPAYAGPTLMPFMGGGNVQVF